MHIEVIPRKNCDYLCLTYKDNEFYQKKKNEIESYKEQAYHNIELEYYDTDENTKSKYWRNKWRIYGLGITGLVDNVEFLRIGYNR